MTAAEIVESRATPAEIPRRAGTLRWLVQKELWDHLHGRRLPLGGLICIILCLLAAFLRVNDYRDAHRERSAFLQRWPHSVEEQLERDETLQVENTRALSPLTVLSVGLEPVVPFRFTSTKEGLRFGQTRAARNSVDALFGYLDLSFVVGTLLSLLAIALTFDSICGEAAAGTLAILLSYPVKRSTVLLSKLIGTMLLLVACFLPAYALAFAYVWLAGIPLLNFVHWLVYGAAALLYVLVFAALGLAVSARARRPADAALLGIFVWTLVVFAMPRTIGVVVNRLRPPAKTVELELAEDQMLSQIRLEYARKEQQAFDNYLAAGGGMRDTEQLLRQRTDALAELRRKRVDVLRRFWEKQMHEEDAREQLTRVLSLLSPTALFHESGAELAWTGFRQRAHFLTEARAYDEKIGRRLAESREVYYAGNANGVTSAMVAHDNVKPFLVPFHPTWVSSDALLGAVVLPLGGLAVFAALFYLCGYAWFLRMDVRA